MKAWALCLVVGRENIRCKSWLETGVLMGDVVMSFLEIDWVFLLLSVIVRVSITDSSFRNKILSSRILSASPMLAL